MTANQGRIVVVAIFRERSKLERAIAKDDGVAATIEQVADEAVIATKEPDGELNVTRSHHSAGRGLALLTAKLMIAVPLGFHGVLAATTAGVEISAAGRRRGEPSEFADTDLRVLSDRMESGWSAVIAVYRDRYLDPALSAFDKLGALAVWHAPEEEVESALRTTRVED